MREAVRAWLAKGEELGVSRRRIVVFGLVFLALAAGRLLERLPAEKIFDAYKATLDAAWWLFIVYAFDKGAQLYLQAKGIAVPADPPAPPSPPSQSRPRQPDNQGA